MKPGKLLLLIVLFAFISFESFAQISNDQYSSTNIDNQINHYLKKSKNQKKLAWIFLGGGLVGNVVFSSMANSRNYEDTRSGPSVLYGISGLAMISSIPLFMASSKNKDNAQLLTFQKNIAAATSDSMKHMYVEQALDYYKGKEKGNKVAAIVLTSAGAAMILGGLLTNVDHNSEDGIFGNFFEQGFRTAMIVSGAGVAALSIPFYVKAAKFKNSAKMILRTGNIPSVEIGKVSPSIHSGRYVALGIAIQL